MHVHVYIVCVPIIFVMALMWLIIVSFIDLPCRINVKWTDQVNSQNNIFTGPIKVDQLKVVMHLSFVSPAPRVPGQ